jgi:ATP-dependent Clp protease ATP-binding subunit ClpA
MTLAKGQKGVEMRIWTDQALATLRRAEDKATIMHHGQLDPLHLLWAFLEGDPLKERTARSLELDPELVAKAAEQDLGYLPREEADPVPSPNEGLRKLLLRAADLAVTSPVPRREGRIGRRELLLALTEDAGRAGALVRNFQTTSGPA